MLKGNSMDTRQLTKALQTISEQQMEIGEAYYCCGGDRMVRDAKRASKRAQRRADACLIAEGLNEWEAEQFGVQAHQLDTSEEDCLADLQKDEIVEECQRNAERLSCLPETFEFFGDCNHPGVIYWAPRALLAPAKAALTREGGSPFDLSRAQVEFWTTEGDNEFMDGYPWNLRAWTNY